MENMNKRESSKIIEVNGRKFIINRFNALSGCYIAFKLLGIVGPIFKTFDKKEVDKDGVSGNDIADILGELTKMSKEDFDYIQRNCLMVVSELYPNNPQPSPPVMSETGDTIGILDYDMPLILNLMIQSLVFNVKGFFPENLSTSSLGGLTTFLQNSKM